MTDKPYTKLTVYSATWCPDCRTAKRFLDQHELEYELIEIDKVDGAAELLEQKTGKRGIPYFVLDEKNWVRAYIPKQGFDRQGMMELLGLE